MSNVNESISSNDVAKNSKFVQIHERHFHLTTCEFEWPKHNLRALQEQSIWYVRIDFNTEWVSYERFLSPFFTLSTYNMYFDNNLNARTLGGNETLSSNRQFSGHAHYKQHAATFGKTIPATTYSTILYWHNVFSVCIFAVLFEMWQRHFDVSIENAEMNERCHGFLHNTQHS